MNEGEDDDDDDGAKRSVEMQDGFNACLVSNESFLKKK